MGAATGDARSSYVRTFNRYEFKYLLRVETAQELARSLEGYVRRDPHDPDGSGYVVSSVYWDSPDLEFFWEKIDGAKFRRKLRFRHYPGHDDVFCEIKQRIDRTTQKRRSRWSRQRILEIFDPAAPGRPLSDEEQADPVLREALWLCHTHRLRPVVTVAYRRQALFGVYEPDLRITIDTRLVYEAAEPEAGRAPDGGKAALDPRVAVLEVKFDDRVPLWLVRCIEHRGIELVRFSKYCAAVDRELFGGQHT